MKKKEISIAFVNHAFLPETYGGAEKQTLRLNLDLQTKNIKTQLLRSFLLFMATFCFFTSLKFLQLAQVNAIFQVAPLFVTALSVLILKEGVGLRRWGGVLAGMIGALILSLKLMVMNYVQATKLSQTLIVQLFKC